MLSTCVMLGQHIQALVYIPKPSNDEKNFLEDLFLASLGSRIVGSMSFFLKKRFIFSYAYAFVPLCRFVDVYLCVGIRICAYVWVFAYVPVWAYLHMCLCVGICICACVCICICACVGLFTHVLECGYRYVCL